MQARNDVDADFGGSAERGNPVARHTTADGRGADDERTDTRGPGIADRQLGHAGVNAAAGQPYLSRAAVGPPFDQSQRGFCIDGIDHVSKEDNIGRLETYCRDAHADSSASYRL